MRKKLLTGFALLLSTFIFLVVGSELSGVSFVTNACAAKMMSDACADCHETIAPSFAKTFHGRAWSGMAMNYSCQSCHGSTDKHVDDPSKQSIISFSKDGGRTAAELSAQCLNCHKKATHLANWDMGAHKKNDVTCVSCHTIHQSRSTVAQPDVCFTCHKDIRSDANKFSHHPIIEGKVKCYDCHNTHGTLTKHMINAESTNQLCYKCHADKRGPWVWEHPPVEENCAICHIPHGSRHVNLLAERTSSLCQNCHDAHAVYDNTVRFGGPGGNIFNQGTFVNRTCMNCHHDVHGTSNFQESFTR